MAARLRKTHQDDVRVKIQASQLVNVIQNHALGTVIVDDPSRIKAAEILLRKTLPDLQSIALTGEDGGPVEHKHSIGFDSSAADLLAKIRSGSN